MNRRRASCDHSVAASTITSAPDLFNNGAPDALAAISRANRIRRNSELSGASGTSGPDGPDVRSRRSRRSGVSGEDGGNCGDGPNYDFGERQSIVSRVSALTEVTGLDEEWFDAVHDDNDDDGGKNSRNEGDGDGGGRDTVGGFIELMEVPLKDVEAGNPLSRSGRRIRRVGSSANLSCASSLTGLDFDDPLKNSNHSSRRMRRIGSNANFSCVSSLKDSFSTILDTSDCTEGTDNRTKNPIHSSSSKGGRSRRSNRSLREDGSGTMRRTRNAQYTRHQSLIGFGAPNSDLHGFNEPLANNKNIRGNDTSRRHNSLPQDHLLQTMQKNINHNRYGRKSSRGSHGSQSSQSQGQCHPKHLRRQSFTYGQSAQGEPTRFDVQNFQQEPMQRHQRHQRRQSHRQYRRHSQGQTRLCQSMIIPPNNNIQSADVWNSNGITPTNISNERNDIDNLRTSNNSDPVSLESNKKMNTGDSNGAIQPKNPRSQFQRRLSMPELPRHDQMKEQYRQSLNNHRGRRHSLTFTPQYSHDELERLAESGELMPTRKASAKLYQSCSNIAVDPAVTDGLNVKSTDDLGLDVPQPSQHPLLSESFHRPAAALATTSTGGVEKLNDVRILAEQDQDDYTDALNMDVSKPIKKRRCNSKGARIVSVLFLLAVTASIAVIVLTNQKSSSDAETEMQLDGGSEKDSAFSPSNHPTQLPLTDPDTSSILEPAPKDLEGQCAPSNFLASKSACLKSCRKAACCYETGGDFMTDEIVDSETSTSNGVSKSKCFDTSHDTYNGRLNNYRCSGYRPYCDIIFDPWVGAEEGKIRPPPINLEEICSFHRQRQHADDAIESDGGSDESADSSSVLIPSRHLVVDSRSFFPESSIFPFQFVGIATRSTSHHNPHNFRELEINQQTCFEACLPSKCCKIQANNTDFTDDSQQKSYVLANCLQTNENSCAVYANHCQVEYELMFGLEASSVSPSTSATVVNSKNIVSTANPSPPPSVRPISIPTLSPTPPRTTPGPTPQPIQTPRPTAKSIPIANQPKIMAACSAPNVINFILSGNMNVRMDCRNACLDGLCCFSGMQGMIAYGSDGKVLNAESCLDGNEDVCAGYSGCLTLALNANDFATQQQSTGPGSSAAASHIPPKPSQDLALLCSAENRADPSGMLECFTECQKGSCCGGVPSADVGGDDDLTLESCFNENEEICALYGPCQALADAYGGDGGPNSPLPPLPPNNLPSICSFDALMGIKLASDNDTFDDSECSSVCAAASCCLNDTCPDAPSESSTAAEDTMQGRCALYEPCRNLEELPLPPNEMADHCQDIDDNSRSKSKECQALCGVASCCFSDTVSNILDAPTGDGSTSSCFALYEETCVKYAPFCSPPKISDSTTHELSSPPSDIVNVCNPSNGDVGACIDICEPASCCFAPQSAKSCFGEYENVCGEWSLCVTQFIPEEEIYPD